MNMHLSEQKIRKHGMTQAEMTNTPTNKEYESSRLKNIKICTFPDKTGPIIPVTIPKKHKKLKIKI